MEQRCVKGARSKDDVTTVNVTRANECRATSRKQHRCVFPENLEFKSKKNTKNRCESYACNMRCTDVTPWHAMDLRGVATSLLTSSTVRACAFFYLYSLLLFLLGCEMKVITFLSRKNISVRVKHTDFIYMYMYMYMTVVVFLSVETTQSLPLILHPISCRKIRSKKKREQNRESCLKCLGMAQRESSRVIGSTLEGIT